MAFKNGNPGKGRPKLEKSFANMLRIAIAEAHDKSSTKLRALADALVTKGIEGDVPALREIADRIDGKVPQALVGDKDHDPISFEVDQNAERLLSSIARVASRTGAGKATE